MRLESGRVGLTLWFGVPGRLLGGEGVQGRDIPDLERGRGAWSAAVAATQQTSSESAAEEDAHGEEKLWHPGAPGGAGLRGGTVRKRPVVQGSMSNQHDHSSDGGQQ